MTLHVDKVTKDTTLTLVIRGVLDYATMDKLNNSLVQVAGFSKVIIDFTDLEFTDSTGIGAVLDVIYSAHEHKASVEFIGLRDEVKQVFETLGVFHILHALHGEGS